MIVTRLAAGAACAAVLCTEAARAGSTPAQVEQGRYLANQVAGCAHCHAGADGKLTGRDMDLSPKELAAGLAPRSKPIAGLPAGRSQAEVATLLMTGQWPGGAHPRPPMPAYGMHRDDAEAVAAYLASLKR
jgi:mono/diheme cytochrome c family protein